MWRLSTIQRISLSNRGVIRAGTARKYHRRAVQPPAAAVTSVPASEKDRSGYSCPRRRLQPDSIGLDRSRRSRCFHTTTAAFSRSWGGSSNDVIDDDDFDPNDPDDIPDYIDLDGLEENYDEDAEANEREEYRLQQAKVNDALDHKKGRPWQDPWEISEEQWMASDTNADNLPDWSPAFVSRIGLERLQVLSAEDGKGIPTLQELTEFSLSGIDPSLHPARETKTYAKHRKRRHFADVAACVQRLAKTRVEALLAEASKDANGDAWSDRQDRVDALFEELQEEAKADAAMDILSKQPSFPQWVDRALEEYLQACEKEARLGVTSGATESPESNTESDGESKEETTAASDSGKADEEAKEMEETTATTTWKERTPIFMDCYDPSDAAGDSTGPMVPKILHPLKPHRHGGPGKMVEEWELSAHATTKRILLRESTQQVAKLLLDAAEAPKIFVHGRRGVGKSALLASIVASARTSGSIVLYLPDGDRLRKNGYFITPSTHPNRKGMFDLQDLSQQTLKELVESHEDDLENMMADRATLELYFKPSQFKRLDEFRADLNDGDGDDGSISLLDLIEWAQEYKKHAPMCYSVVVNRLMQQTDKNFLIVMDEFNGLFDKGHYFHMAYDEDVREPIPHTKISLFEPIMDAMGISTKTVEEEEDEEGSEKPASTFDASTTAIMVATSESHAVRRATTDALTECAQRTAAVSTIEVPRFSSDEADHVLANFEATGVGKLRLDRGDTLMNSQELEYLKMASGSIGQKLLDVSIL